MSSSSIWKKYNLGDLADYLNGKAFKPSDWNKKGLPIVRIQNLTDIAKPFNYFNGDIEERYLVDNGELLVSWSATLGSFIWNRGPAVLNQHIFKVVPNNNLVDKEFLHYLILNTLEEISKQAHGLAMKHITKKKFEKIQVNIPDLKEQRRIVARIKECMERVDEIEGLRSEVCSEADKLQSAVFADFINSYSKDQLINDVLGDVIVECKYGTSKKANTQGKGYPILRMGNIQAGKIDITALKHIDLNNIEKNKYLLQEGDIVINRTNSLELVGKSAVFSGLSGEWIYASYLIRLRLDHNKALPKYVNAVINSSIGRNYVFQTARRAIGMVNINAQEIKRMPLPLPSIKEQEELVSKLNETEPIIDDMLSSFNEGEFAHLRESILHKAFAGEL